MSYNWTQAAGQGRAFNRHTCSLWVSGFWLIFKIQVPVHSSWKNHERYNYSQRQIFSSTTVVLLKTFVKFRIFRNAYLF